MSQDQIASIEIKHLDHTPSFVCEVHSKLGNISFDNLNSAIALDNVDS